MDLMKYAAKSPQTVSAEALNTLKDIAESIHKHSMMSQWDRANIHMKEALLEAKSQANNKTQFLKLTKQRTGLLKNTDPLLVWCVKEWY